MVSKTVKRLVVIGLAGLIVALSYIGYRYFTREGAEKRMSIVKTQEGLVFKFKNPAPLDPEDFENDPLVKKIIACEHSFYKALDDYCSGDFPNADNEFEAVISIFPQFSEAYYYRGLIAEKHDDLESAIHHFGKAVDCFGGHLQAHLALADIYMKRKEFAKAKLHFNVAKEIFSFESRAYTGLGRIFFHESNMELSQEMAETALKKNPFDADAHALMGDVYLRKGKEGKADTHYRLAVTINPTLNIDRKTAFGADGLPILTVDEILEDAVVFAWNVKLAVCNHSVIGLAHAKALGEDFNAAIEELRNLIEENPYATDVRNYLAKVLAAKGYTLREAGKLAEAASYYEESIAMGSPEEVWQSAGCLAYMLEKQGETDKAAYYLRRAIESYRAKEESEESRRSIVNLVMLLTRIHPRAYWVYTDRQAEESDRLQSMALKVLSAAVEGKVDEEDIHTLEHLVKWARQSELRSIAYLAIASGYSLLEQHEKAIATAKECLNVCPATSDAHCRIVMSELDRGAKPDDFRSHMMMSVLIEPDDELLYQSFIAAYLEEYEKTKSPYDKRYAELLTNSLESIRFSKSLPSKLGL